MKPRVPLCLVLVALVLVASGGQWMLRANAPDAPKPHEVRVGPPAPRGDAPAEVPPHRPTGYKPTVATGVTDHQGNAIRVACMTCHTTREPDLDNGVAGATPKTFHQGQVYAHGGQSCLSCHHSGDYDSLRLADGRKLAFSDAQKLCSQCHGPQTRDYLNGSHGGMRGYWDKSKGGRTRNTCTDCHDAHAPAFPLVTPIFPPRDAGARQQAEREAAAASDHSKSPVHE